MPRKFFILLYMIVAIMLGFGIIILYKKEDEIAKSLGKTVICGLGVTISYIFVVAFDQYYIMSLAHSVMFIFVDWTLYYLLKFTATYTSWKYDIYKYSWIIQIILLIDSIVLLINPFNEIALTYEINSVNGGNYLQLISKLPYEIHLMLCYIMIALMLFFYVYKIFHTSSIYRRQYILICSTFVILCIVNALYVFTNFYIDLSILTYGILALLILFYVYHYEPAHFLRLVEKELFLNQNASVIIFDEKQKCIAHNNSAQTLFSLSKKDWRTSLVDFLEKYGLDYLDSLEENGQFEWRVTSNDKERYFIVTYQMMLDKKHFCVGSYLMISETTEKHQLECYDRLTGIYNRDFFCRETKRMLQRVGTKHYIVVAFDIQNFKIINEVMGTKTGDLVLRFVADILYINRMLDVTFGRISADNFIVCVNEDLFEPEKIEHDLWKACLEHGFYIENKLNFGIYKLNNVSKNLDVEQMCDRAMLALRKGKDSYLDKISVYQENMSQKMLQENFMINEMSKALQEEQFEVFLQPQYDSNKEIIKGSEALVRWNHPTRGYLSPIEFIPVFEENGLISQLDKYVWEKSCQYLKRWKDNGQDMENLSISVNISRLDLYYMDVLSVLLDLVDKYDIDKSCLKLEITESAYVQEESSIITTIKELQSVGFIVEMDDFGSGYSSLNCLKSAPVDILKLDMRFLLDDGKHNRGEKIISWIVKMAIDIGLIVIAEGVETANQAELMKNVGVQIIQGYYYAKPMHIDEFERKYIKIEEFYEESI